MTVSAIFHKFISKFKWLVIIGWLIFAGFGGWLGPMTLTRTEMNFQPPPDSPSSIAVREMGIDFPIFANNSQSILYFEHQDKHMTSSILGPDFASVSRKLENWFHSYKVSYLPLQFLGFYSFLDRGMQEIGQQFVSPHNYSSIIVMATNSSELEVLQRFSVEVKEYVDALPEMKSLKAYETGFGSMVKDAQAIAIDDFESIDIYIAPLAFIVLAIVVDSLRMMIVALFSIGISVFTSLLLLYALTYAVPILTFGPVIMMSCLIAFSIDYSLFLLTRFREECSKEKEDQVNVMTIQEGYKPVETMLRTSGHNVLTSGAAVTLCFAGLIMSPVSILSSIGICATIGVAMSLAVNLSFIPAVLLAFPSFFKVSSRGSLHKLYYEVKNMVKRGDVEKENEKGKENEGEKEEGDGKSTSKVFQSLHSSIGNAMTTSYDALGEGEGDCDVSLRLNINVAVVDEEENEAEGTEQKGNRGGGNGRILMPGKMSSSLARIRKQQRKSLWNRAAAFAMKYPFSVVLFTVSISIVAGWHTLSPFKTTMDLSQLIPSSCDSSTALNLVSQEFSQGLVSPFFVLMKTNQTSYFSSDAGFQKGIDVINGIAYGNVTALNSSMINSVMFAGSVDRTFTYEAVRHLFLDPQFSPHTYYSQEGYSYRYLWSQSVNSDNSSCVLEIQLDSNPYGNLVEQMVGDIRKALKYEESKSNIDIELYLVGNSVLIVDVKEAIWKQFPIMISVTIIACCILVGILFRSIVLPFRLVATTLLTLSWVYCAAVLIFQDGIIDAIVPVLAKSDHLIWFAAPAMAFSTIVGLGIDYDIFVITRVLEYRLLGVSMRQSVLNAVYQTGWIVTCAGIIMTLAFGGLLASKMLVIQQYSFYLVFACILDTFLVRTVLVPAVTYLLGDYNFWPRKLPPETKGDMWADEF